MTNQPACGTDEAMPKPHHHYEFGDFEERLAHFCVLFEIEPPQILYEDGEPTLTDSFMDWIKETNADMNWLFAGSPCSMLREWTNARKQERRLLELKRQLEPEVQAGMLALMTAVVEHGLPIEEPLEIFDKVVSDWRANSERKGSHEAGSGRPSTA